MKVWFTSDYHLGHENIIEYCNRPFNSIEHMNVSLIRNHNQRVKPEDTVFFLGDFCFRNTEGGKAGEGQLNRAEFYLKQLNGRFVFIRGNHDHNNSLNTPIHSAVIEMGGHHIYLVHNPEDFEPNFKFIFCGHVHGAWKFKKIKNLIGFVGHTENLSKKIKERLYGETVLVNMSCDVWKYMPVSYNEIMKAYEKWKKNEEKT